MMKIKRIFLFDRKFNEMKKNFIVKKIKAWDKGEALSITSFSNSSYGLNMCESENMLRPHRVVATEEFQKGIDERK